MRPGRRRIWLGALGGTAALGAGLLLLAWMLLSTEWGTRQVWRRIETRLPDAVGVQEVRGRLRSPIEVRGLTLEGESYRVRVGRIRMEWNLWPLLRRTLSMRAVEVEDVDVFLVAGPSPDEGSESPPPLPALVLPVTLLLDEAIVHRVSIESDAAGREPLLLDSLRADGLSMGERLELLSLSLFGPGGRLAISGWVDPGEDYPLSLALEGALSVPGQPTVEGRLALTGDLRLTTFEAEITAPARAELSGTLLEPRGARRFQVEASAPDVEARAIREEWPDVRGGGRFVASGTLDSLQARGNVRIVTPQTGTVELQTLLRWAGSTVEFEELLATQDETRVEASGLVTLTDGEPELDLNVSWRSLQWPLQGAPDARSDRGTLAIQGIPSAYRITMEGVGELADGRGGSVSLAGRGNRERMLLDDLRALALGGNFRTTGEVRWAPEVRWDLRVAAEELDPSAFLSTLVEDPTRWSGRLAAGVRTRGSVGPSFTEGDVFLDDLRGVVREEELTGSVDAAFRVFKPRPGAPPSFPRVTLRSLELTWGPNHLSALGTIADTLDLEVNLLAPELGTAIPDAAGRVEVEGRFSGLRSLPQIQLEVLGNDLVFREGAVSELMLTAEVDARPGGVVAVEGRAAVLTLGGEPRLDSLFLDIRGAPEAHRLVTRFVAPQGRVDLTAEGGLQDRVWTGTLEALDLTADPWGVWTLEDPSALSASTSSVELEEACMQSESASLCADGSWQAEGVTAFEATVRELSLHQFRSSLPEDWTLSGILNAEAAVRIAQDNSIQAVAAGDLDLVRIGYPTRQGSRELLLSGVRLRGAADEEGARAEVDMRVSAEGAPDIDELTARVALPELTHLGLELPSQPVSGSLQAHLTDFSAVEALVPRVEDVTAELTVNVSISGTVQHPELLGEARLAGGAMTVPGLGIALQDMEAVARGEGRGWTRIEGQLRSGGGAVRFEGTVPMAPSASTPALIRFRGESFLAADLPEVSVWISPELDVSASPEEVQVSGRVGIPRARAEFTELSPSAVAPSRDVVFVEDSLAVRSSGPAINTSVRVVLGDSISFRGFGFSAQPRGSILATDAPGRATTGTGELNLSGGRYRAYGQDLTMERGRILFAGGGHRQSRPGHSCQPKGP
ncbi:translocation/assembly module TamB domain-containing protein [Gemmatimonadota bacterium]